MIKQGGEQCVSWSGSHFRSWPATPRLCTGKAEKVFQQLMEELKPEAAYFHAVNGDRGGGLLFCH